jgi:hypothetical protein
LFLSRKTHGHLFVARQVKPGHVAEPTRLGKGRKIAETGVWGVSLGEAKRWFKNHVPGRKLTDALDRLSA